MKFKKKQRAYVSDNFEHDVDNYFMVLKNSSKIYPRNFNEEIKNDYNMCDINEKHGNELILSENHLVGLF